MYSIGGTPFSEGYGLEIMNGMCICYSGSYFRTVQLTSDIIKTTKPELDKIKVLLESCLKCYEYNNFEIAFIKWIMHGCSIIPTAPDDSRTNIIHMICVIEGNKIIHQLRKITHTHLNKTV